MPGSVYQVALPLPLPQLFDYLPPPGTSADAAAIGGRIRVPLGRREAVGVIAGLSAAEDPAVLRAAEALLDPPPLFHGQLLASLQWLARSSEEHTSELPSLMRISYAVFCLKKKTMI